MPNTKVGQEDFREAAAMRNLTPALTLMAINKGIVAQDKHCLIRKAEPGWWPPCWEDPKALEL